MISNSKSSQYTEPKSPSTFVSFPDSFTVGEYRVPPLVTPEQVVGHLALLNSFAEFKRRVEGDEGYQVVEIQKKVNRFMLNNLEDRWKLFVGLAVER
jgi:hypothetical protein